MGRVLAIDYGKRWVGFAISDPLKLIANPLKELDLKKGKLIEVIESILKEFEVDEIIIGLPITMSGKKTPLYTEIREIKKDIEKRFRIKISLWDERFTTKMAKDIDKESHKNAAAFLLQDYLNSLRLKDDN
jgi:putative Holliday junction resolvase